MNSGLRLRLWLCLLLSGDALMEHIHYVMHHFSLEIMLLLSNKFFQHSCSFICSIKIWAKGGVYRISRFSESFRKETQDLEMHERWPFIIESKKTCQMSKKKEIQKIRG